MPTLRRRNEPDIHYEVDDYTDPWKDAPYILLQHGYGRSSKFWYRWVPYLSRFYRVIRPDLRGLGQSSKDFDMAKELSTASYLRDLNAVLDDVGVESVHYCGESLGGILGMIFAAEHPKRVRTLNCISTPLFLDQDFQNRSKFGYSSWEEALRTLGAKGYALAKNKSDRFSPDTDPGLMAWFADEQGASDVEVLIAMQRIATGIDATPYLHKIEAPVLFIAPTEGPIVTPKQEQLMRAQIRNIRIVHLPSRHHNLHLTQHMACVRHVLHFAAHHDGVGCHE
ncbi:MAG: alpha/beta hydrolase [Betaproteobacteria bacterium]|nr:MAG: alpha/beta hydrolase [Betaproteobacteria bacterium]